jgi:hypothetical protein
MLTNIGCSAQYLQMQYDPSTSLSILKDTLWLGQGIWKEAKLMGIINNPLCSINCTEDARSFDFLIVPFYKISEKGIDFKLNNDISEYIILDTATFGAFIQYQDSIVGHINVLFKHNRWRGVALDLFENNSPMKLAYKHIIKFKPNFIFAIKYLGGLWFIVDNHVMVYSYFNKQITSSKDYIINNSLIESIREYAKGQEGGIKE